MAAPAIGPRALALREALAALLTDTHQTPDDLLPWWERQRGGTRLELVRSLRLLVEEGKAEKDGRGYRRPGPENENKPDPEALAPEPPAAKAQPRPPVAPAVAPPPRPDPPAPRAEAPAPRPEPLAADQAVAHKPEASEPRPAAPEPAPAAVKVEAVKVEAVKVEAVAARAPQAAPKPEPTAVRAEPLVKLAPVAPKPEPAAEALAARASAETHEPETAEASEPPASSEQPIRAKPSRPEPMPGTLAAQVLVKIRSKPQTCAELLTLFPDSNKNTVRGALARLKADGWIGQDKDGVYCDAQGTPPRPPPA